jgi:hypothetical protein
MTPSDFSTYRTGHNFKAPCCLCVLTAPDGNYTECAIYLAVRGPYAGEYICGCVLDRCGYLGMLALTLIGLLSLDSED